MNIDSQLRISVAGVYDLEGQSRYFRYYTTFKIDIKPVLFAIVFLEATRDGEASRFGEIRVR